MQTAIENGDYRVRVYSKNLNTAYEENPNDTYKIEMWKEVYSERKVLKRFEQPAQATTTHKRQRSQGKGGREENLI